MTHDCGCALCRKLIDFARLYVEPVAADFVTPATPEYSLAARLTPLVGKFTMLDAMADALIREIDG